MMILLLVLLLQVVLHSQIAKDNNEFDIQDVAKMLNDKLKIVSLNETIPYQKYYIETNHLNL